MEQKKPSNYYKLDSEDYENIYLRVREKLLKIILSAIGLASIIGVTTYYYSMSNAIEKQVGELIKTREFQDKVIEQSLSRVQELEDRLAVARQEINTVTQQAVSLSELPVSIDDSGIIIYDKNGDSLKIEYGTARNGSNIFKSAFDGQPSVSISLVGATGSSNIPPRIHSISGVGFSIEFTGELRRYTYVAIGKPKIVKH